MKAFKIVGVVIMIVALIMGLGIIGRVDNEDREYRSGEIAQEEMTSAEDLVVQILTCAGIGVLGGALWAIGAYVEADRFERSYLRRAR